ncbi:MAG: S-ribosylhomocysteine lyase [Oscillospiraceae bacterium]|nr:S-ribosylhomocysteine lyase [Oscillospiraceae bacterium]
MQTIASFTVDHIRLQPGLYVSRKDSSKDVTATTFDLRVTRPNREPVMDMPAVHTIEHLGATFLRNSSRRDDVIYFGPMGCRTGFYLVMFGDLDSEGVYPLVMEMCDFILGFEGDIPGAAPEQCGNWSEQNLSMAKYYISKYKEILETEKNFRYPGQEA